MPLSPVFVIWGALGKIPIIPKPTLWELGTGNNVVRVCVVIIILTTCVEKEQVQFSVLFINIATIMMYEGLNLEMERFHMNTHEYI